jgi:mannosyltransferase OCH1-like enzyme
MLKIGKIIHYCWFGSRPMSRLNLRCLESWRKYMPDYEIMLWNENNSPMEHPYAKVAMKKKLYAFASDYARLHALQKFGGIYMDTDMELIKNPEPILDGLEFFSGYEKIEAKVVSCGIFGACKNSDIINQMLEYIDEHCVPKKYFVTIPAIATHIIKKMPENELAKIFPYEYFYPYNPSDEQGDKQLMYSSITPSTYAIHHWEASWVNNIFLNRLKRKLEKILRLNWCVSYEVI